MVLPLCTCCLVPGSACESPLLRQLTKNKRNAPLLPLPPRHTTQVICQNIVAGKLRFPTDKAGGEKFSPEAKALCRRLLHPVPSRRYGVGYRGGAEIQKDPYFAGLDWATYLKRQVEAPWLPKLDGAADASNFDPYKVDNTIDESYQDKTEWDKDFVYPKRPGSAF